MINTIDPYMSVIKDNDIDLELKKVLIDKIHDERRYELSTKSENKRFWHNTPLVVSLVGVLTIASNTLASYTLKNLDSGVATAKDQQAFAFRLIEKELSKTDDANARAKVLLFLVKAGVLDSLNKSELELMARADLSRTELKNISVGIPPTLGSKASVYNLASPKYDVRQSQVMYKILLLAVNEINKNIDENESFEEVEKYFSIIPNVNISEAKLRDLPWSAALTSWLINEAGASATIRPSAATTELWKQGLEKGIAFIPFQKEPLPGDIAFFLRRGSTQSLPDVRSGKTKALMSSGIVYSAGDNVITTIGGNVSNAIRTTTRPLNDKDIVGYVRIPD